MTETTAATNVLTALFPNAQSAQRAVTAMRGLVLEVQGPIPVKSPVDGLPWSLEISVPIGASSVRYLSPVLTDQVIEIVRRYHGVMREG